MDEINQIFELFAQHYKSVRGLDPSSWQSDLAELRDERQRIEAEGYFNVENIEDAKKGLQLLLCNGKDNLNFVVSYLLLMLVGALFLAVMQSQQ